MTFKIFSFLLILFSTITSFSQEKKFAYYFDDKLNITKKSKSALTGTGNMEGGLLSLHVVENKTEREILFSHYTDSSLAVRQGLYQSFFMNGIKESEGNFESGKENGLWKTWDSKGRLLDSSFFDHGKKTRGATFAFFKSARSYKFEDFVNDKMEEVIYNDSGLVTMEASFTGKSGIVKRYSKEGITVDSVFTRESSEASFPGGKAAWAKYIQDIIVKNIDDITRDNQSGTCRLRFIVDKEGNVTNVEVMTMKGSLLASVAKDALQNGPKWIPAIQYGKPVNAYREQPVTFTLNNK